MKLTHGFLVQSAQTIENLSYNWGPRNNVFALGICLEFVIVL